MGSINSRGKWLHISFYYHGKRCREATGLSNTPQGRALAQKKLKWIEAEMILGRFEYAKHFPNGTNAEKFMLHDARIKERIGKSVAFKNFALLWAQENGPYWVEKTKDDVRTILENDLIPFFGDRGVDTITKADILQFRELIGNRKGQKSEKLGASRVNRIMAKLKAIIEEAADRYEFKSPWRNIRQLRVRRQELQPFSLKEVMTLVNHVRPDYKDYLTVRFFTGMRTGEINGLFWSDIDFESGTINISRSFTEGEFISPKTETSKRPILMADIVRQALERQFKATGQLGKFVFCSPKGLPVDNRNFRRRVWVPLLRYLDLAVRSPYQTRHTTATLWLAAGESPEWIARQMGHTTTEMLFNVYSRYVPNMARRDGSAFESVLQKHLGEQDHQQPNGHNKEL